MRASIFSSCAAIFLFLTCFILDVVFYVDPHWYNLIALILLLLFGINPINAVIEWIKNKNKK